MSRQLGAQFHSASGQSLGRLETAGKLSPKYVLSVKPWMLQVDPYLVLRGIFLEMVSLQRL